MRNTLLAVVGFLFLSPALAGPELRVGEVKARPGSQVVVPIEVQTGELLTAMEFRIEFDPNRLAVVGQESVSRGPALRDHSLLTSWRTDSLKAVIFSSSVSRLNTGTLFWVKFQVAQANKMGDVTGLTLTSIQGVGVDAKPIALVPQNGKVTISESLNEPKDGENERIFPHIAVLQRSG